MLLSKVREKKSVSFSSNRYNMPGYCSRKLEDILIERNWNLTPPEGIRLIKEYFSTISSNFPPDEKLGARYNP